MKSPPPKPFREVLPPGGHGNLLGLALGGLVDEAQTLQFAVSLVAFGTPCPLRDLGWLGLRGGFGYRVHSSWSLGVRVKVFQLNPSHLTCRQLQLLKF